MRDVGQRGPSDGEASRDGDPSDPPTLARFIRMQPYFQAFTSAQQEDYLHRAAAMEKKSPLSLSRLETLFAENVFLDEAIVGYDRHASSTRLEIVLAATVPVFTTLIAFAAVFLRYLDFSGDFSFPVRPLTVVLNATGIFLGALGFLVADEKLADWDEKIREFVRRVPHSTWMAVKRSLLISRHRAVDLIDWVILPCFLYMAFGVYSSADGTPPPELMAYLFCWSGYRYLRFEQMGPRRYVVAMVAVMFAWKFIPDGMTMSRFVRATTPYFQIVPLWFLGLGASLEVYRWVPLLRQSAYRTFLVFGAPFIAIRLLARIALLALALPPFLLLRLAAMAKRKLLLGFLGFLLMGAAALIAA